MILAYYLMLNTIFVLPVVCKQPHILLVVADDLGWNDVGYHNSDIHTPTLDSLAETGVKLENYYVQSVCGPSRSQLLTGRYQIHTGLQHYGGIHGIAQGLPLEVPTLADKLNGCGYRTHLVGKWHLGFHQEEYWPNNRGFDTFYGILGGMTDYYSHRMCFTVQNTQLCGLDFYNNFQPVTNKNGSYATEVYSDRVAELVSEHAEAHAEKPVFVYMAFQTPHIPLQVPEKYLQHYGHINNPTRKLFAGMVTALDVAVKKIVDSFKDNGLWDDTVTIFTTDNGGMRAVGGDNDPLKGGKGSLWEGGIKAVGFVHGHMISSPRTSSSELIHVSDWFPTLLNLAECGTDGMDLDGYDMWQTISHNEASPRNELLLNIDPVVEPKGQSSMCGAFNTRVRAGIRIGEWKLLTGNPDATAYRSDAVALGFPSNSIIFKFPDLSGPGEEDKNVWLYNIEEDPLETVDLSEDFPSIVEYMCERLACYNCTALPAYFQPMDFSASPKYHGDLWTHWL